MKKYRALTGSHKDQIGTFCGMVGNPPSAIRLEFPDGYVGDYHPSKAEETGDSPIGRKVERLGSAKDYTTGRTGEVVEVKDDRYRVRWTKENNGSPITTMGAKPENGVRTWVNKRFLKFI